MQQTEIVLERVCPRIGFLSTGEIGLFPTLPVVAITFFDFERSTRITDIVVHFSKCVPIARVQKIEYEKILFPSV